MAIEDKGPSEWAIDTGRKVALAIHADPKLWQPVTGLTPTQRDAYQDEEPHGVSLNVIADHVITALDRARAEGDAAGYERGVRDERARWLGCLAVSGRDYPIESGATDMELAARLLREKWGELGFGLALRLDRLAVVIRGARVDDGKGGG